MSKPYELEHAFSKLLPDLALWNDLYSKNQQEYIRRRLKAIKLLWEGRSRAEVQGKLDVNGSTLIEWIRLLVERGVEAGLRQLARSKTVQKSGKLTLEQEQQLLALITDSTPRDLGYEQNIFTGKLLQEVVRDKWDVTVSDQTIYNIFQRHKWSYQRAHRDYENADASEQAAFVEQVKADLEARPAAQDVYFFDEFSISNRPTLYYGWAPRNSKFHVPSDEKKNAHDSMAS